MQNYFYQLALNQAKHALTVEEVPIGCIITQNNIIKISTHNLTNKLKNPLAHAEILALKQLDSYENLTCYVNVEPCLMCADILKGIECKVFYGVRNPIFGASAVQLGLDIGVCIGCDESVELLKMFYELENGNAPIEKRKLKNKRGA